MEEKVKLISLNEKQWHYKLIKFVFGNSLPDPRSLKNLCPYFWVTIASMILVVPVLPFKLIGMLIRGTKTAWRKSKEAAVSRWIKTLSLAEAFDLYYGNWYEDEVIKRPKFAKENYSDSYMLGEWAEANDLKRDDPEYREKLAAMFEKIKIEREELKKQKNSAYNLIRAAKQERERKRDERREKIQTKLNAVGDIFKPIGKSLKDTFTFEVKNFNQVVKLTKQFVGLVVTIAVAIGLSYLGQLLTWGVLSLVSVWNGAAVLAVLITVGKILGYGIAGGLPVGLLLYSIRALIIKAVNQWEKKGNVPLYAKPFLWFGHGVIAIWDYVLFPVIYFIFVTLIWKIICLSLVWGIVKGLGVALIKFTGIFGEYFGSSYTDMCPGVSWGDDDK
ncbi:MAG: hypothetical protein WC979_02160 [Candidatus Pacearchaeota archaeon]|jgi:hypothetical protein|nr:hypothetical protein [Clostridia bacterium]